MDWQTIASMDWQAIGTLVALVGVIASFLVDIRGQRLQRQLAEANAERSEAAARLSDEQAQRVIDVLGKIATQGTTPPRVRWSLDHLSGSRYVLTNTGDEDAWDVNVEMHDTMRVGDEPLTYERIGPDEAESFFAAPVLATPDFTITVAWNAKQGDFDTRQQWRYPLPMPSRR